MPNRFIRSPPLAHSSGFHGTGRPSIPPSPPAAGVLCSDMAQFLLLSSALTGATETGSMARMDFEIPKDIAEFLADMDRFIERELHPLEQQDDNMRFFDHRRENARTDWDRGGLPNPQWEALLHTVRKMADDAGFYRYPLPKKYGGRGGTNLGMAIIREHLA